MDGVFHFAQAKDPAARKHGLAWIALCLALAVHVIDETLTDFLSVYNPAVRAIRSKLPFLPLPTFSFEIWLLGLIFAVLLLLSLAIFVFRGSKWMRPLSYVFAIIMLLNGMLHVAGSFYLGRMMPGVYSSPLLLAGSVYLLVCLHQKGKTL
jgi:Protein of unknown function with HXXEE motif